MPKRLIALTAALALGLTAAACSTGTDTPENGPRTTDNTILIEVNPPQGG